MMTNVDFEGFNDWSDKELIEAINTINAIIESRKKEKVLNALKKVEDAMVELQKTTGEIDFFELDGNYTLADVFEAISLYYKERMK